MITGTALLLRKKEYVKIPVGKVNNDYLDSSAGTFLIRNKNISCTGKSVWYEKTGVFITPLSLFKIDEGLFKLKHVVYLPGEQLGSDRLMTKFFKDVTSGKGVKQLPRDWWKQFG